METVISLFPCNLKWKESELDITEVCVRDLKQNQKCLDLGWMGSTNTCPHEEY